MNRSPSCFSGACDPSHKFPAFSPLALPQACEAFEKAASCYRAALALDGRHYTAWYGLGTVYFRQEKFPQAEFHLRQALMLNPRSSVLGCYLGMALHMLGRPTDALAQLEAACAVDSRNQLARYEKAGVLVSLERFVEALAELEALKQAAPREATVYFLIGKVYKKLKQRDAALTHFAIALDLKPSTNDVNLIKCAPRREALAGLAFKEDNFYRYYYNPYRPFFFPSFVFPCRSAIEKVNLPDADQEDEL